MARDEHHGPLSVSFLRPRHGLPHSPKASTTGQCIRCCTSDEARACILAGARQSSRVPFRLAASARLRPCHAWLPTGSRASLLLRVDRYSQENGLVVLGFVVDQDTPVNGPQPSDERHAKEKLHDPDEDSGGAVSLHPREDGTKAREEDVEDEAAHARRFGHRWDLLKRLAQGLSQVHSRRHSSPKTTCCWRTSRQAFLQVSIAAPRPHPQPQRAQSPLQSLSAPRRALPPAAEQKWLPTRTPECGRNLKMVCSGLVRASFACRVSAARSCDNSLA